MHVFVISVLLQYCNCSNGFTASSWERHALQAQYWHRCFQMNNWVSLKMMPLIVSVHQDCSAFQQPAIEKTPTIQLKIKAFFACTDRVGQCVFFLCGSQIYLALLLVQIVFISTQPLYSTQNYFICTQVPIAVSKCFTISLFYHPVVRIQDNTEGP